MHLLKRCPVCIRSVYEYAVRHSPPLAEGSNRPFHTYDYLSLYITAKNVRNGTWLSFQDESIPSFFPPLCTDTSSVRIGGKKYLF